MTIHDLPPRMILERLSVELTARQYDVFLMRVVEGATIRVIANRLSITPQTVTSHWEAARLKVRKIEWEKR